MVRALARILKFARHYWKSARPKWSKMAWNWLKLYKMFQNGHFLPVKNESKLPVKMMGMTGPS